MRGSVFAVGAKWRQAGQRSPSSDLGAHALLAHGTRLQHRRQHAFAGHRTGLQDIRGRTRRPVSAHRSSSSANTRRDDSSHIAMPSATVIRPSSVAARRYEFRPHRWTLVRRRQDTTVGQQSAPARESDLHGLRTNRERQSCPRHACTTPVWPPVRSAHRSPAAASNCRRVSIDPLPQHVAVQPRNAARHRHQADPTPSPQSSRARAILAVGSPETMHDLRHSPAGAWLHRNDRRRNGRSSRLQPARWMCPPSTLYCVNRGAVSSWTLIGWRAAAACIGHATFRNSSQQPAQQGRLERDLLHARAVVTRRSRGRHEGKPPTLQIRIRMQRHAGRRHIAPGHLDPVDVRTVQPPRATPEHRDTTAQNAAQRRPACRPMCRLSRWSQQRTRQGD